MPTKPHYKLLTSSLSEVKTGLQSKLPHLLPRYCESDQNSQMTTYVKILSFFSHLWLISEYDISFDW